MADFRHHIIAILKVLLFIAVCVSGYFLITNYMSDFEPNRDERAFLAAKGQLTVGYSERNQPFSYRERQNREEGISIEAVREIGRVLGIFIQLTPIGPVRYEDFLRSEGVDVLLSSPGRMRSDQFDETIPMFDVPVSLFLHKDTPGIKSRSDLNGKKIGIVRGSDVEPIVRDWFGVITLNAGDHESLFAMLLDGKVDAIVAKHQAIMYQARVTGQQDKIKIVPDIAYLRESLFVFGKNQQLKQLLDRAIQHLKNKGVLDGIERRALGESYSKRFVSVHLFFTFSVVLLALALVLVLIPVTRQAKGPAQMIIRPPEPLIEISSGVLLTRLHVVDLLKQIGRDLRLSAIFLISPNGEVFQFPENVAPQDKADSVTVLKLGNALAFEQVINYAGWYIAVLPHGGKVAIRERSLKLNSEILTQAFIYFSIAELTAMVVELDAMQRTTKEIINTSLDQAGFLFLVLTEGLIIEEAYGTVHPLRSEGLVGTDFLSLLTNESANTLSKEFKKYDRMRAFESAGNIELNVEKTQIPCAYRLQMKVLSRGTRYIAEIRDERAQSRLVSLALDAYRTYSAATTANAYLAALDRMFLAVRSYSKIINDKDVPESVLPHLRKIRDFALRGSTLTEELLAIVRERNRPLQVLELGAFITDYIKPLSEIFDTHKFNFDDLPRPLYVDGDPHILATAFLAVFSNAVEASPTYSMIRISVSTRTFNDVFKAVCGRVPRGLTAVISIEDKGIGIQATNQSKLFQPFFTTKGEPHKGLGLLGAVAALQTVSGGLDLRSETGKGTSVIFYIPVRERAAAVEPNIEGNGESILIYSDRKDTLDIVHALFERYKYKPSSASSNDDVVRLVQSEVFDVVLIVTDKGETATVVLCEEIRRRRPTALVVIAATPGEVSTIQRQLRDSLVRIIVRTADYKQILRNVREILSARIGT